MNTPADTPALPGPVPLHRRIGKRLRSLFALALSALPALAEMERIGALGTIEQPVASLEDLAHMFQISGVETGLNLEALQPLAEEIAALTQEPIQSRLHKAGPAYALKVCQP